MKIFAVILATLGIFGGGLALGLCFPLGRERDAKWQRSKDCAIEAERRFRNDGNSNYDAKTQSSASFANHFNYDLNSCFMVITRVSSTGSIPSSGELLDAVEGNEIGDYVLAARPDGTITPMFCEVTSRSGEKRFCKSKEEFDEMVRPYMGAALEKVVKK